MELRTHTEPRPRDDAQVQIPVCTVRDAQHSTDPRWLEVGTSWNIHEKNKDVRFRTQPCLGL